MKQSSKPERTVMKGPFGGQIKQNQHGDYCSTVAAVAATVVRLD